MSLLGYGQTKDTIYLKANHIIINGQVFNELKSGVKEGYWIEYKFIPFIKEEGALWQGPKRWGYYSVDTIYRPLQEGEYSGIKNVKADDSTNRDNGWKSYNYEAEIIMDYIPSSLYYIESKGNYKNGKKVGLWEYYNQEGKLIRSEKND
jgi:hypothetical protein